MGTLNSLSKRSDRNLLDTFTIIVTAEYFNEIETSKLKLMLTSTKTN